MTPPAGPGPNGGRNSSETPGEYPGETHKQRIDRELGELLAGLRVATTGVQVLFAFLLIVPFSPGFPRLGADQHGLLLTALLSAAVASICLISPAAQHRVLFRSGVEAKELLLRRSNIYSILGAGSLGVAMLAATMMVLRVLTNEWWAIGLGLAVAMIGTWCWFVQPLVTRLTRRRNG
ncbi:DUF6328 family protein [Rhizohabitans arisaemae]|uniref:DUF6328 family protein n=1 Tax=Rhizohabitans arisaemae TaxID=2720610 RepID=UPI0024B07951|nr:DUF6328 family protein [Rhizohabitans arisaemae]